MINLKDYKHYNINDVVMFYNRYNYELSNQKCPKCLGSKKIYYKDENLELKSSICSCYFGFVYAKNRDFKKDIHRVSFGFIQGIKIHSDGSRTYQINSSINSYGSKSTKEVLRYYNFFKNESDLFDFPIDGSSTISYQVDHDDIIRSVSKFNNEYENYEISDYDYIFKKNDLVYWSSETYIYDTCNLCNNTNKIKNIEGNEIPCPKHRNYRLGHRENILCYGIVNDIFLEIELHIKNSDNEILNKPFIKVKYVLEIIQGKGFENINGNHYNQKTNYSLSYGCKLTKNLDEALLLLEEKK